MTRPARREASAFAVSVVNLRRPLVGGITKDVQMADQTGVASRRREPSASVAWEPRAARPADADVAVQAHRQVRTGPLRLHTIEVLDRDPGLETRLPRLILFGIGVLAAIQIFLTH